MESLPFWEMQPHNELVKDGNALCLAQPGRDDALDLPTGGPIAVPLAPDVSHEVAWWNPAGGKDGHFQAKETVAGGRLRSTAPTGRDWAVRIIRITEDCAKDCSSSFATDSSRRGPRPVFEARAVPHRSKHRHWRQ